MSRIVALDVGDATIGVAVTDELMIAAYPHVTLRRGGSLRADLRAVEDLCARNGASVVVVGLPLTPEGELSAQAEKVKDFADRLAKRLRVPVETIDESFSTVEAEERLLETDASRARRRKVIDSAAAAVILEDYLRQRRQAT